MYCAKVPCFCILDYTTNNISPASGKAFARPRVVDQLAHDISLDDAVRVHCVNKELLLSKLYIISTYVFVDVFNYRTSRDCQVRLQPPYHEDYLHSHPVRI